MIGVDVCSLNGDERFAVIRRRAETFTEQVGDDFNKSALKTRIARRLVGAAVMTDFDEFLIYEFDTALTGDFEEFDLWFDEQVECEFWDEKTGTWAGRIADSCADVEDGEVEVWVDCFEGVAKDGVEDVVNSSTTTKLLCGYFGGCTVDGGDE